MKEIVATMTQRSQVTIPAEARRILGLKPRDKVAFRIEDDQVYIRRARLTLESAFGSVAPATATEEFDQLVQRAKAERAEQATHVVRSR